MLRGKTGKNFLIQFARQMVQFGAIIFCRTFVELFWSVQVVFENKTETSKVGAISMAQKSALFKNLFKWRTPSDFLKIESVAKYQKS